MKNPIKPTFKTEIIPITLIVLSFVASVYFYQNFPEQVPMHWNISGEVDDWGSKTVASFVLPVVILIMYSLFLILPAFDPKQKRYEQFVKIYHFFKNTLILFMSLIYAVLGINGLGYTCIDVGIVIPFSVGILFIVLGNYMAKIKSNFFIGIRTPWTLANEQVWNKTHRFGGKIFMLSGFLIACTPFVSLELRSYVFISAILLIVLGTVGYSLLAYIKEQKK